MSIDASLRVTPETLDLLDTPLRDLSSEKGWRRTLPLSVTNNKIVIPSRHELGSYLDNASEETEEARKDGFGYSSVSKHPVMSTSLWTSITDDSHEAVTGEGVVEWTDTIHPKVRRNMRLSAQEIIDMGFENGGRCMQSANISGDISFPGKEKKRTSFATITLNNPVHKITHQFTPLEASHILYEANESVWKACYLGGMTFGELVTVIHDYDEISGYLPRIHSIDAKCEDDAELAFASLIPAMRGKVEPDDMLGWVALMHEYHGTSDDAVALEAFAQLAVVKDLLRNHAASISSILEYKQSGIDPALVASLLGA